MYLTRFGVKRYKCLGDIDIPLTPMHVLIGQNDAGKTALLEAMAAFHATSEMELMYAFPQPWTGHELLLHGSSDTHIELWGEWATLASDNVREPYSNFRYGFAIDFPNRGNNCTISEEWVEYPKVSTDKRAFPSRGHPFTAVCRRKHGEFSFPENVAADLEQIATVLKPAHKYALDAKVMAIPAAIDPQRKFRMDADGFGLATLLDDILDDDAELFIQLRKTFCKFYSQFKSVRLETENALQRQYGPEGIHGSGPGRGKGIYFKTGSGETVRAQQASDGAILFLALLALAHLPYPPTLLLIEEPENGIYPHRLGEVVNILKEMVNHAEGVRFPQIILTTHSPYVLSFFEPEEVTFLSREPGKPGAPVRARPLRDAPNIKERMGEEEFYLGELWYNLSEEDLFGGP